MHPVDRVKVLLRSDRRVRKQRWWRDTREQHGVADTHSQQVHQENQRRDMSQTFFACVKRRAEVSVHDRQSEPHLHIILVTGVQSKVGDLREQRFHIDEYASLYLLLFRSALSVGL